MTMHTPSTSLSMSTFGKRKRQCDAADESVLSGAAKTEFNNGTVQSEDQQHEYDDELESASDEGDENGLGYEGIVKWEYFEAQEPFPKVAIYDDRINEILSKCYRYVEGAKDILGDVKHPTKAIEGFLAKAESLERVPTMEPVKIAFLGDTGVGKSSTTNSLLDFPDLAKEGAFGRACTCVVTEYRRPHPRQKEKLAAVVYFFDEEKTRKLLQQQLTSYNLFHFQAEAGWDKDSRNVYELRAKTAIETFQALFCCREGFASYDKARMYLASRQNYAAATLDSMTAWCKDLLAKHRHQDIKTDEMGQTYAQYEASSAKQLRMSIDPLMTSKPRYTEPSLWPLVHKVSIGIKDSRVLQNITLADLPGVSDTNQIRVNSTFEYLTTCDHLWIVSRIDRIVTDPSVTSLVQRYAERFAGKITLIGTRSDDFDMRKLADEYRHDEAMKPYHAFTRKYREATAELIKYEQIVLQMEATEERGMESVRRQRKEAEIKRDGFNRQRLDVLVKVRNKDFSDDLWRDKRGYLVPGTELGVYFVSNKHYAALKGVCILAQPRFDAAGTGVPALRSYALEIPAPALLKTFEKYVTHDFYVFAKGVNLWANKQHVKSPEELRLVVAKPKAEFDAMMRAFTQQIKAVAADTVGLPIRHQQELLAAKAVKVVKGLGKWHYCTIRAFVTNGGKYNTSVKPKQSWNEDFMNYATANIVNPAWAKLQSQASQFLEDTGEKIFGMLLGILEDLKSEPDAVCLQLPRFLEVVYAQAKGMSAAVEVQQERYNKELANIKLNATQDVVSGYFTQAMADCYEKAQQDRGPGVKARILDLLENTLDRSGDSSPFVVMAEGIELAIKRNAETCMKHLQRDFAKIIESIQADFDRMIENGPPDHRETPVRAALKAYTERVEHELDQLTIELDEVKKKYRVA